MKWYNQNATLQDIIALNHLTSAFNVKLFITKKYNYSGTADGYNRCITIHPEHAMNGSIRSLLSTICHELVHIICFDEGYFYLYHHNKFKMTKKNINKVRRIGLKAERFVDKKAKILMSELFPGIPYKGHYSDKAAAKWYTQNYLNINFPRR